MATADCAEVRCDLDLLDDETLRRLIVRNDGQPLAPFPE